MPEFPIDPDLAALSDALGGLSPAAPALNRDRLLYDAGRRAARPRLAWPVATGLFAVLAVGLGIRPMTMPLPPPRVEIVYVEREAKPDRYPATDVAGSPPIALTRSPAAGYLRLRDDVVRFGPDSLPFVHGTAPQPRLPRSVEKLFGLPPGTLDDALKSRLEHQISGGDV